MSQSLSMVYIHAVFSTKNRTPCIAPPEVQHEIWAYISGISKQLECPILSIGGVEDHMHVLFRMGREINQATWIMNVKRSVSVWVKTKWPARSDFYWQNGYGMFSVSPSNLEEVCEYIHNQEAHHQKMDFQTEYRCLLKKHGLEWDERYVWD